MRGAGFSLSCVPGLGPQDPVRQVPPSPHGMCKLLRPLPVSWAVRPVCVVSPCPCSVTCKVSRPFWASGLWVLDVPRTAGGFSGFGVLGKLKARGMLWKFNLRGAGAPKVQDWAWPQKVDPQSSCMGWRRGRDQSFVFSGSIGSADTLIGAHCDGREGGDSSWGPPSFTGPDSHPGNHYRPATQPWLFGTDATVGAWRPSHLIQAAGSRPERPTEQL